MFSIKSIFLTVLALGIVIIAYAYITRVSEESIDLDAARSALATSNEVVIPAQYNNGVEKSIEIIPDYTYSGMYSPAQKLEREKMWSDLLQSIYQKISCTGNGCIEYVLSATCSSGATTTIFLKREGGDDDVRLYTDIERARAREFNLEYGC